MKLFQLEQAIHFIISVFKVSKFSKPGRAVDWVLMRVYVFWHLFLNFTTYFVPVLF